MTVYVWIDLETTGFDVKTCQIIELAAIITTEDFIPLEEYSSVINPGAVSYEDGAKELHKRSGLYDEVRHGKSLEEVEEDLLALIMRYEPRKRRAYFAGNNVYFDRKFLDDRMPSITNHMTSRHLDVSSFAVLMNAKFGKEKAEFKSPRPHRALGDLQRSISELQFYLENFVKE